jgi:hypothetical protein
VLAGLRPLSFAMPEEKKAVPFDSHIGDSAARQSRCSARVLG